MNRPSAESHFRHPTVARGLWVTATLFVVGCGALAFGGNHRSVYWPLLAACAALGTAGLYLAPAPPRKRTWLLGASLALVVVGVIAQLVPLPATVVATLSPAAAQVLEQYDLAYSLGLDATRALSLEPARTRVGLAALVSLTLLLLGTAAIVTREMSTRLAGGIVGLGALLAVIGIVQRAAMTGKIYGLWQPFQASTPFGPFVNRNHFAGWMLMGLPVAVGLLAMTVTRGLRGTPPDWRRRVLWASTREGTQAMLIGFAIVLMASSLLLTLSRSGMVALAVVVAVAAFHAGIRGTSTFARALPAAAVIASLAAVSLFVDSEKLVARFVEPSTMNAANRFDIWADSWRVIQDFWRTGTGLNTWGVSMLYYQTALPTQHVGQAHNDFLQLAAEGGLLLGIPIVLSIAAFWSLAARSLNQERGTARLLRLGAIYSMVAISVQSLAEFSLQMPGNAALFAVIAGLALHDGAERSAV